MKSFLLLAAVYSLIIHQWHKEKETAKSQMKTNQQVVAKKQEQKKAPLTTAILFQKSFAHLYDE